MKRIIYYLIAERKVSWRKWKDIFMGTTWAYANCETILAGGLNALNIEAIRTVRPIWSM